MILLPFKITSILLLLTPAISSHFPLEFIIPAKIPSPSLPNTDLEDLFFDSARPTSCIWRCACCIHFVCCLQFFNQRSYHVRDRSKCYCYFAVFYSNIATQANTGRKVRWFLDNFSVGLQEFSNSRSATETDTRVRRWNAQVHFKLLQRRLVCPKWHQLFVWAIPFTLLLLLPFTARSSLRLSSAMTHLTAIILNSISQKLRLLCHSFLLTTHRISFVPLLEKQKLPAYLRIHFHRPLSKKMKSQPVWYP